MRGIRFTLGVAVASSQRERDSVCVGSKQRDCGRKGVDKVNTYISRPLATAVITYKNELTRENQPLRQEPSTSRRWMLNGNDPFIPLRALLQASTSSSPMNLEDLNEAQLPSTPHCRNISPIGIFSRTQKPASPEWAIIAVESGERAGQFCKKLLQGVRGDLLRH